MTLLCKPCDYSNCDVNVSLVLSGLESIEGVFLSRLPRFRECNVTNFDDQVKTQELRFKLSLATPNEKTIFPFALLTFRRFWNAHRRRTQRRRTWRSLARTERDSARRREAAASTGASSSSRCSSWQAAWGTYWSVWLWDSTEDCTTSPITSFCPSPLPIYSSACSWCHWVRSQDSWVSFFFFFARSITALGKISIASIDSRVFSK